MIKDYVCEHGKNPGWWIETYGTDGQLMWNGPLSTCECCGAVFGYVNASSMTSSGKSTYHWGRVWTPIDRCPGCGGKYKEYGVAPSKARSKDS